MNHSKKTRIFLPKSLFTAMLIFISINLNAQREQGQRISLGIHADPMICWFGSDNNLITNKGSRPGFNFGVLFNKYFAPNYSFSTGLNIMSTGGRLISSDTTKFDLLYGNTTKTVTVLPHESIVYRIQYLSVPLGLKLQTNQIGYITYFTDLGLDPKVRVGGKADIPSLNISGEKATSEIKMFNLSYHITAGIEYGIGGPTAVILGISFENNFFDATKDIGAQPVDKITHRMLSFRLGMKF